MLWKNAIVPSALEFVRRPDTEKTIHACPQDRYKQYTDPHIIRHNNMAIFCPAYSFG